MNVFIEDGKLYYRVNSHDVIYVSDISYNVNSNGGKEYKLGAIDGEDSGLYFFSLDHMDKYFNKYHANSCLRKVKYISRRKAKEQVKRFNDNDVMNIYHCIFCNGYHVGHNSKGVVGVVEECVGSKEKQRGVLIDKFLDNAKVFLNDVMARIEIIKSNKVTKYLNYENIVKVGVIEFSFDGYEFSKQKDSLRQVIRNKLLLKLGSHKIVLSDINLDLLISFEYELLRLKYFINHEELVEWVMVSWGGDLV